MTTDNTDRNTEFRHGVSNILYDELVERSYYSPNIRRIGEFRSYRIDENAGSYNGRDGRCFTLCVGNLLQGLVVISDGQVSANVAATSSRLFRQLATTGSDEFTMLENAATRATELFTGAEHNTTYSLEAVAVKIDRPDGDDSAIGEEEVLYLGGSRGRTDWIGFNRRNDENYMELTVMAARGRVAEEISELAKHYSII